MDQTSYWQVSLFVVERLDRNKPLQILDIGSLDVNGTYRPLFNSPVWKYTGLDIVPGRNVDVVSNDPYHYPLGSGSFDVVVSGQVLEHVEDIYAWAEEAARVLKPGGLMYVIAPSSWPEHKFPVDCWRFLPDGFRFLFVKRAKLSEVKINREGDFCIGIFKKEET